jgi:hypothetical protein
VKLNKKTDESHAFARLARPRACRVERCRRVVGAEAHFAVEGNNPQLFAFPSLAPRARYRREQASRTSTAAEDPTRGDKIFEERFHETSRSQTN